MDREAIIVSIIIFVYLLGSLAFARYLYANTKEESGEECFKVGLAWPVLVTILLVETFIKGGRKKKGG